MLHFTVCCCCIFHSDFFIIACFQFSLFLACGIYHYEQPLNKCKKNLGFNQQFKDCNNSTKYHFNPFNLIVLISRDMVQNLQSVYSSVVYIAVWTSQMAGYVALSAMPHMLMLRAMYM